MSWIRRLFRSGLPEPGVASVRSVRFDTTGLRLEGRTTDRMEWHDLHGDRIVATVERQTADLVRPALDIDALRAQYRNAAAARGGGIVSLDVVCASGIATARVVTKYEERPAYIYEGTLLIPLRNARFTLTMRARERGVTGTREAVTTAHLLRCGLMRIPEGPPNSGPRRIEGFLLDPYDAAYDGTALCALCDDERLDELFPGHPLSKVRQWLRTVGETLTIDDAVRPAPVQEIPASQPDSRVSRQIPAATIGLLYLTAGRWSTAEALFTESLPLDRGEPAVHDTQVADNLTFLGLAREMQGKFAEAEWAMTRAYQMFQTILGDADIRTVRAMAHRARVYTSLRRFTDAGSLFEQALPALKEHGASGEIAVALNGLGLVRTAAGQHRDAIAYFEQALQHFEQAEKEQGKPISDRATVLNNLGNALEAIGDRRGAAAARARARTASAEADVW